VEEWVGSKIEGKLRETLGLVGSVMEITLFNSTNGEYGVQLTNNPKASCQPNEKDMQLYVVAVARPTVCSRDGCNLEGEIMSA